MMPTACWSVFESGQTPPTSQRETVGSELIVEWRTKRIQLDPRIVSFSGEVKATFGPTTLYADELVLNYDTKEGHANGSVRLIDPDGTLQAKDLEFNWAEHTGRASDVEIETTGARIYVSKLEISPDQWLLYNGRATICNERDPKFWVTSSLTKLRPGHNGEARKLGIDLLGWKLGPIPFMTFSLDQRVTGLRLPAISFRRKVGLGMAWSSSFLLQDNLSVTATTANFPKLMPSYSALFTYSFLPADQSHGLIAPRSDLGERFADSYMDSVGVEAPYEEDAYVRQKKATLSAGTAWNLSTRGRALDLTSVSKSAEIVGEAGGVFGQLGGFVQVRPQSIRQDGGSPFKNRLALFTVANLGDIHLAPRIDLRFRADTASYIGSETYSWQRAQTAIVFQPTKQVRISGGYTHVWEHGQPQLPFDRLQASRSWDLRGDVQLGPLSISALFRYDSTTKRWYDHEYSVSLIAGCFEPYVIVRQTPSDLNFGVRFRIDALLGKLQQRKYQRSPAKGDGGMSHEP